MRIYGATRFLGRKMIKSRRTSRVNTGASLLEGCVRLAMIHKATTLGLSERRERVLAYMFFCFSGVVLFVFEKNRNVRWHAMQSMLTFGVLFVLMFVVSMLRSILGIIPLLSNLTNFGL